MMNDSPQKQRNTLLLVLGVGTAVIFLMLCVGLAGFALGRFTASPEIVTETVVETVETQVEVTREVAVEVPVEVPVTVEVTPPPTPTSESSLPGARNETAGDSLDVAETESPAAESGDEVNVQSLDLDVFYEVWGLVDEEFDGSLPTEADLLDAIIQGSLETLDDDYTRYVEPEIAELLREDMGGSVEGIGAFVRENDEGQIEIVRPIDGQPADAAGLLPGDIVIGVDGEDVVGQSLDEVILKVRGPQGTAVTLLIDRDGEEEPLEFTIIRTRFEIPIIETEYYEEENVAYIRLAEFNRNATEALTAALAEALARNPDGLIFDLRDNPGGFLDQSIMVADQFLGAGIVAYERNNAGLDETFRSFDGELAENVPLVVLVNVGSASASEIVAGAIQDNGRGVLIGETTFGKGSVQTVRTLSNQAELRVTIARWYTPANNTIDGGGITPDIEVESPLDLGGEDDTQLQRALDYFRDGE